MWCIVNNELELISPSILKIHSTEKLSRSQPQAVAPYPILDFLRRRCFLVPRRYDDPVRKFTGSDHLGPANNNLIQVIHAFVHFAWVYSREQLLFCDMQGLSPI